MSFINILVEAAGIESASLFLFTFVLDHFSIIDSLNFYPYGLFFCKDFSLTNFFTDSLMKDGVKYNQIISLERKLQSNVIIVNIIH